MLWTNFFGKDVYHGGKFIVKFNQGVTHDNDLKGIIPRMIDSVFDFIQNSNEDIEFSVKCSFIEIYNEKIQDLLDRNLIFLTKF